MMFVRNTLIPWSRALGILMAFVLPAATLGSSRAHGQQNRTCPTPASIIRETEGPLAHIRYLADDALEGREVSTPGARCAADYIAGELRRLGLEGAGPGGSFFQSFQVKMGRTLGQGNSLSIDESGLSLVGDWTPFGFTQNGDVAAPLIYGGPGVSMPGREEDAYAHLDLEGKIVVVEAGDPHGSTGSSLAGDPHFKASVAAGRNAAGILLLLPEGASLPDPVNETRPSVKIPALAIAPGQAEAVREAAKAGLEAELSTAVEPRLMEARNVVAIVPGQDPTLAREVVIVGAHYDHLGYGGDNSLAPDAREVHNGADDNASGTAALLDAARILASAPEPPARTVLFIAFTGEEKGLWGSGHYVENPLLPMENTVAMINMDMVGRLRENTLTVYGTGTAQEWLDLLERVNGAQPEPFTVASIPDGFGASDHSEFYGASIPVLMLFTNTHSEYHRPEDDWEFINEEGLERIGAFAADITSELAGTAGEDALALTLVEGAGGPRRGMAADADASSRPGFRASMGTIPDMTPQDFGVRITGVRPGSAAEKAGLKGGDVIVEFGGKEISDLYAYTYALREHEPGDEVTVVVLRDGERMSLTAVLGGGR